MKRTNTFNIALPVVAVLLVTGCATDREMLFFGTHTAIGVDVSGTVGAPDSVSLGYRRNEVAIVPPKSDGSARSVLGAIDADLGIGEARVKQLFATGDAAVLAASRSGPPTTGTEKIQNQDTTRKLPVPILFVADANFSLLHVQVPSTASTSLAPRVSLGYSRNEITLIPVTDDSKEVASVYADISIDTGGVADAPKQSTSMVEKEVGQHPSRFTGGVRIVQNFATGEAAVKLVSENQDVKNRLLAVATGKTVNASNKQRKAPGVRIVVASIESETWGR